MHSNLQPYVLYILRTTNLEAVQNISAYYTDFVINQPTTALLYNLQHVSAANYSAIIRKDTFRRQQAAYDTLVNG
jgi:hypothetical protein